MNTFIGEAFFKLKQFEEAERWYQQALKAKADHIPAHLTYAKLLSKWVSVSLNCSDILILSQYSLKKFRYTS